MAYISFESIQKIGHFSIVVDSYFGNETQTGFPEIYVWL